MSHEAKSAKKRPAAVRQCPVCGHESWCIIYGMVMRDTVDQNPRTEFAGCCISYETRVYPATGQVEMGLPKWACQNAECGHRWW